jgi:hypothetical protein
VREESCAVWFCGFDGIGREREVHEAGARLAADVGSALGARAGADVRVLRPTPRSLISGTSS